MLLSDMHIYLVPKSALSLAVLTIDSENSVDSLQVVSKRSLAVSDASCIEICFCVAFINLFTLDAIQNLSAHKSVTPVCIE